jgi:hypothetical protein
MGGRTTTISLIAALLAALFVAGYSAPTGAQEGHPLKGSWLGAWESNATHGENVLLVLDWDGQDIRGIINPGTDNIRIAEASLDPEGWIVRLEAEAEDSSGNPLRYLIEARIENLELPNRSIVGTWRNERGRGAFEVSRQ